MNDSNKILYVEDDPSIQAVAKLALEVIGKLTVKVCSSGEEALLVAEQFNPDLILLDVMMPGMDGPSTLQELRKLPTLTHLPVVFMTAKVQEKEIQYYKSLGAKEVIAKPFDPMTLASQVKEILNS